eukprot:CAMPEP_0196580258 /NCGR_PEP_ID=MMETSP1081-20130531/28086_1 /TAXON_ID=36882 /ORGANISM="Pyramimonas amylifera, Strain CCMP720" /LENGTH=119 /DNA_ID=CAMNT_0041900085 /DNA_START=380 /DNA_END=739 /DNA_ORIENTATION=-
MRRGPGAPPNRRKLLQAAAAGVALLAFQQATKGSITDTRKVLLQREMLSGMKVGYSLRVPGDVFMYDGEGHVTYQGEDGLRVDMNGDIFEEILDGDGKLESLKYYGNVNTLDLGNFDSK